MASSTTSNDAHVDDEYEDLAYKQRLKASVYYTVMQLCKEVEVAMDTKINRQVTAAIAETTCRQLEHYATDAELFAKHGKRTTVNTDDIKLLARKTPKLVDHLNEIHEETMSTKPSNKSKKKQGKTTKKTNINLLDEESNDGGEMVEY